MTENKASHCSLRRAVVKGRAAALGKTRVGYYPGRDAQRAGWVHIPHGWHVQTRQLSIRWTGASVGGGRIGGGLDSFSIWHVAPSHISQSSEWWRCERPSKKKKSWGITACTRPKNCTTGWKLYFNSSIPLGWSKVGVGGTVINLRLF